MAEIHVVAIIRVKLDFIETARPHVKQLVTKSRLEPGTLIYDFFEDVNEPGTYVFIQKYVNLQAFKAHQETQHFKSIIAVFKEWATAAPEIKVLNQVKIDQ